MREKRLIRGVTDRTAKIAFATAGLLLMLAVGQVSADTIDVVSGRGIRGKVTAMNANTVTVTLTNGSEQAIPSHTISRISFDGEPNALRAARRSFGGGQYNRVAESLDSVAPDNPYQIVEKSYLLAVSSAKLALRGEAGKTIKESHTELKAFVENGENKRWFQYFQALETFGDLERAMGNLDAAITQYQILLKSSSPEVILVGKYKTANIQMIQNKFAEARKAFQEIVDDQADTGNSIEQKLMARVGIARCDGELTDAKKAIETVKSIIKTEDASKAKLFGCAYNALGHCYKKNQQSKEAMLAFLHTDVLYQRDASIHAEALFELRALFRENQKPKQADDADKLLTTTYKNTYWGAQAIKAKLGGG